MWQACPAKYFLRIHEHWATRRKSAALGFGGALHEGLAEWYRTGSQAKAVEAIVDAWPAAMPVDDWRTKEKAITVMAQYMKQHPQETFQIVGAPHAPMVEVTYTLDTGLCLDCDQCGWHFTRDQAVLVDEVLHCPVCGAILEVIEYGGIFDTLVEFSGVVYVLEHKTTSRMGSYYFDQFKPNNQVAGYCWAAGKLSGKRVGGAIINAIGIYRVGATRFDRQITTRSDSDIERWLTNLRATCQMIRDCERRGYWPQFTQSCTMYGKCEYHDVHVLSTDIEQEKFLEQQYVRQEWSYETRDEPLGENGE